MSGSIKTEWVYQQNLNIREIRGTPASLIKFPLQITGLNYGFPSTSPDIAELVETEIHLKWLVEKYELFLARKRLARISHSPRSNNLRPECFEHAYNFPQVYKPGMPGASDEWLVPRPYNPSVNINTERLSSSLTPTTVTLTAPGTLV